MPMAISANWGGFGGGLRCCNLTESNRSVNKHWWWLEKWRRWAFYGLQRPLERRFSDKTSLSGRSSCPKASKFCNGSEHTVLSLNPKKFRSRYGILSPYSRLLAGHWGPQGAAQKKRPLRILFPGQKCNKISEINGCLVAGRPGLAVFNVYELSSLVDIHRIVHNSSQWH